MLERNDTNWVRTEDEHDGLPYWSWQSDCLPPNEDHPEVLELFSEIRGWWKNANPVCLEPDYDFHLEEPLLIKDKVNRCVYESDDKRFEEVEDWVTFQISLKIYNDADDVAFKLRYAS